MKQTTFDEFVERYNIQSNEMGAAFAAWLSGFGWDGDFMKVENDDVTRIEKP